MTELIQVSGNKGKGGQPSEKANTLFSTATARVVDLLCEGEIEGFVDAEHPERSVFFDNVPMMEDEIIETITSVTALTRTYTVPSMSSGFVAGRTIRVVGCAIAANNGDYTIESVTATTIKLTKADNVKLVNETPPGTAYIALMNFKGADLEVRYGTPDQQPLTGISEVEATFEKNAEVKFGSTIYFQISNPNIDDVKINIRFQSLVRTTGEGNVVGSTVVFRLLRRWEGGTFVEFDRKTITGKTTSDYEIQYRYNLRSEPFLQGQPVGNFPLDIQVDRITPDSDTVKKQDAFFLNSWVEVQNVKLQYPNCALAGLKVVAELFGGRVPQRSYHIKGLKIKYPTGYNPLTQTYPEFWDGTFTTGWCDNPAWVFYDILTNKRYGLGEYISEDQVDKESLYEIAKYCDCVDENGVQTLIDDGYGGTERRFVFNGVIEAREEAYTVLQALASVFRGMAYWSAGGVSSSQDSPKDYTRLVSRANVVGGDFTYTGTALKARHTAALVTWNDPEDNYKQAVEVVEDQELINTYGWRPMEVVAFATTSRGQANRVGKWILDSERYETETVTFTAGVDFQNVRPGEIIAISDPTRTGVRRGGRILSYADYSGGGSILYIDMPYAAQEGDVLLVLNTEDVIEELPIQAGTVGNFLLVESPAGTLQPDAMFIIQGTSLVPETWRVLSMRETEPHLYEITALQYDGNKFARVEENLSLAERPTSFLPTGKLSPPSNLTMVENLVRNNNFVSTVLDISWAPSDDPRAMVYVLEYAPPGGEWSAPIYTNGVTYKIPEALPSYYDEEDEEYKHWNFRLRAQKTYESAATQSDPIFLIDQVVVGKTAPPANVTNFRGARSYSQVTLTWDAVSDVDLVGYDIVEGSEEWPLNPENTDATDPNSPRVIALGHVSTRLQFPCESQEFKTYQIRARDDTGNLSALPTQVTRDGTTFGLVFPSLPDITNLRSYQIGSTVKLIWGSATGSVGFSYEIRMGSTTDTWDESLPVGTTANTQFIIPVSVGVATTFRFRVRVFVQWSGGGRGYGTEATTDITKWPIIGANLVFTREEHTLGWPGTLSSELEVVGGELRLKEDEVFGTYEYTVDLTTEKTGRLFKRDVAYFDAISGLLIDDATMLIYDADFPINNVTNADGTPNIRYFLEFTPEIEFEEADYKFTSVVVRIEFSREPTDDFRPTLSELITYFHEPAEMQ